VRLLVVGVLVATVAAFALTTPAHGGSSGFTPCDGNRFYFEFTLQISEVRGGETCQHSARMWTRMVSDIHNGCFRAKHFRVLDCRVGSYRCHVRVTRYNQPEEGQVRMRTECRYAGKVARYHYSLG
jgi:hypothetical protein